MEVISAAPAKIVRSEASADGHDTEHHKLDAHAVFKNETVVNSDGSRKRKRDAAHIHSTDGVFFNRYCQLLNENIEVANATVLEEDATAFESSQLDSIGWIAEEKLIFFAKLDRLTPDDARKIAVAIGTKSEVEVHQYIQHLQRAATAAEGHKNASGQLLEFPNFPAAAEISERCCKLLEEEMADQIIFHTVQEDSELEEAKFGGYWLLDDMLCNDLELIPSTKDIFQAGKRSSPEGTHKQSLKSAMELLNLKDWLCLSRSVFMNQGAPREDLNWRNISLNEECPSIFASAFIDYYSLATSITKRLVQTCIYIATSRLRSNDVYSSAKELEDQGSTDARIKAVDVSNALEVLGMRPNLHSFWQKIPDQYGLRLYHEKKPGKLTGRPLPTNEVRLHLSASQKVYPYFKPLSTKHKPKRDLRHSSSSSGMTTSTSDSESPTSGDVRAQASSDIDRDSDPDSSPAQSELKASEAPITGKEEAAQDALDAHLDFMAEAVDKSRNFKEESRFWDMLRRDVPESLNTPGVPFPSADRQPKESSNQVPFSWRDRIDYRSEWEEFGAGLTHRLPNTPIVVQGPIDPGSQLDLNTVRIPSAFSYPHSKAAQRKGNAKLAKATDRPAKAAKVSSRSQSASPEGSPEMSRSGTPSDHGLSSSRAQSSNGQPSVPSSSSET